MKNGIHFTTVGFKFNPTSPGEPGVALNMAHPVHFSVHTFKDIRSMTTTSRLEEFQKTIAQTSARETPTGPDPIREQRIARGYKNLLEAIKTGQYSYA